MMSPSMESRRRRSALLLLLPLALLCVCSVGSDRCPSHPVFSDLTCHSDYDHVITCVWSGAAASERPDDACTVSAKLYSRSPSLLPLSHRTFSTSRFSSRSCRLEPVDASRPTLKKCSMDFNKKGCFLSHSELLVDLSCSSTKIPEYRPYCHIKLDPPSRPDVNVTTASWSVTASRRLESFRSQLQWKHEDQAWTDPPVQNNILSTDHKTTGAVELDEDQLTWGETYEARVRVKPVEDDSMSTWSDWSPVASWESRVGRTKRRSSDLNHNVGVPVTVAAAAAFAVFLVVLRFKTDKTTWVYMVKRIRGPPLPNPAKSFLQDANFQSSLSRHFTDESSQSLLKPEAIVSVEVTSAVDAVAPCGPEAALLEKMRSEGRHETTSSNFSNPSYSQLCPRPPPPPPPPPPPVSSLTAGNLAPCVADTPYGPVGGRGEKAEQEVRGGEQEEEMIRLLLSKGGGESTLVVSDYERVEKIQVERVRLQSLDSGMCSGEEVSQESLEVDSINVTEGEEEGEEESEEEGEEEGEEEESEGGDGKEVDFRKLFRGGLDEGSIRVCSGYERVRTPPPPPPNGSELLSVDSGVGGEEEEEDVDKASESTCLLFPNPPPPPPPPPPPCSSSPCFLPLFTPRPLDFCGSGSALTSTSRSVEPSGDGYL